MYNCMMCVSFIVKILTVLCYILFYHVIFDFIVYYVLLNGMWMVWYSMYFVYSTVYSVLPWHMLYHHVLSYDSK